MAKMNDVHVVGSYMLNTGLDDEGVLPESSHITRIYRFSDGTAVEHGVLSFYARDGNPMKPKEVYDYLKGLSGRRGIWDGMQKALGIGPYASYNRFRWLVVSREDYDRIGIPELFDSPPTDHKYLGFIITGFGVSTIVQALHYGLPEIFDSGYEPIDKNYEEEELQPDLSVGECIKETKEKIQRDSKAVGDVFDSLDEGRRILELLEWSKVRAASR